MTRPGLARCCRCRLRTLSQANEPMEPVRAVLRVTGLNSVVEVCEAESTGELLRQKAGGEPRLGARATDPALEAPVPDSLRLCLARRSIAAIRRSALLPGGMTTAAATRSPGSRCSRRTPCAERPDSRIVFESMRMILPYWLISMTSDFSSTCAIADDFAVALRGLHVDDALAAAIGAGGIRRRQCACRSRSR